MRQSKKSADRRRDEAKKDERMPLCFFLFISVEIQIETETKTEINIHLNR